MDEYIKKEALIERLNCNGAMNMPPLEYCREVITKFPAADVVEVRHGKWIKKEDGHYICSECGRTRPYSNYAHAIDNWVCNYCHYCGVKMDGGKKQ